MKPDAETPEIDLREFDFSADDAFTEQDARSALPPADFSWVGFAGAVAALCWIAGAIAAPVGYFGFAGVAALHPALHIALAAIVFGPAVLIWVGSAAAAEAGRTRKIAARIEAGGVAVAMPAAQPPGEEAAPLQASALLREEIEALNQAVEGAVARLGQIETAASRNIAAFENAISVGGDGAGALTALLDRERAAMTALNGELKTETETLARNVSRQIRLVQEAAKIFKTEVAAAETTMQTQAESFGDMADLMGERTAAFVQAAETAGDARAQLDDALAAALDALSHASRLNDEARQNAEEAALAAQSAAEGVREATAQAVVDARRAAETVREEAQAAEEAAEHATARLSAMAEAARMASVDAQAAADRHSSIIERRLASLAETAKTAKTAARTTAFVDEEAHEPVRLRAGAGVSRVAVGAPTRAATWTGSADKAAFHGLNAANERGADPFGLREAQDPDTTLVADIMGLCAEAGVTPGEQLTTADLERIAARARFGAASRRRAVNEAAPGAVQRLTRHLRRHPEAKDLAGAFRARPDLAKVNRRGDNADVVCAYLLIETALA
jgi:hypothetical protein